MNDAYSKNKQSERRFKVIIRHNKDDSINDLHTAVRKQSVYTRTENSGKHT